MQQAELKPTLKLGVPAADFGCVWPLKALNLLPGYWLGRAQVRLNSLDTPGAIELAETYIAISQQMQRLREIRHGS